MIIIKYPNKNWSGKKYVLLKTNSQYVWSFKMLFNVLLLCCIIDIPHIQNSLITYCCEYFSIYPCSKPVKTGVLYSFPGFAFLPSQVLQLPPPLECCGGGGGGESVGWSPAVKWEVDLSAQLFYLKTVGKWLQQYSMTEGDEKWGVVNVCTIHF